MLPARRLWLAVVIAMVFGAGSTRPAEASECFDQLLRDTTACLTQRDKCIAETSFWTRTCNIEYLICEAGAEMAYVDCNAAAIGSIISAVLN